MNPHRYNENGVPDAPASQGYQRPAPVGPLSQTHVQALRAPLPLQRLPGDTYEAALVRPQARHLWSVAAPHDVLISAPPTGSSPPVPVPPMSLLRVPAGIPPLPESLFTGPASLPPPVSPFTASSTGARQLFAAQPVPATLPPQPPPSLPFAALTPSVGVPTLRSKKRRDPPVRITARRPDGDHVPRDKKLRRAPDVSERRWPHETDATFVALLRLVGSKWDVIATNLGAQYSQNDVKNRFHSTLRRLERQYKNHGANSLFNMQDCPKNRTPIFNFLRNLFKSAGYDAKKVGDVQLAAVSGDAPAPIGVNVSANAPAPTGTTVSAGAVNAIVVSTAYAHRAPASRQR